MRITLIFIMALSCSPLLAQVPPLPLVRPPVSNNPNVLPPNPEVPPAPNPPNPYNPYGTIAGATGSPFSDANAAAMHFINIVDNQIYRGAWLDAAGILQDVVTEEMWSEGLRAVRMHLGPVRARKVVNHRPARALPGGLVGEFMIIQYATQFSRKPNASETVTLIMTAPLGIWKVVSYRIEP